MVSAPPPAITEMSGLMIFVVSAVTMDVNAPPMITATAKSITLPRLMNSLNSLRNFFMTLPFFACGHIVNEAGQKKRKASPWAKPSCSMVCFA